MNYERISIFIIIALIIMTSFIPVYSAEEMHTGWNGISNISPNEAYTWKEEVDITVTTDGAPDTQEDYRIALYIDGGASPVDEEQYISTSNQQLEYEDAEIGTEYEYKVQLYQWNEDFGGFWEHIDTDTQTHTVTGEEWSWDGITDISPDSYEDDTVVDKTITVHGSPDDGRDWRIRMTSPETYTESNVEGEDSIEIPHNNADTDVEYQYTIRLEFFNMIEEEWYLEEEVTENHETEFTGVEEPEITYFSSTRQREKAIRGYMEWTVGDYSSVDIRFRLGHWDEDTVYSDWVTRTSDSGTAGYSEWIDDVNSRTGYNIRAQLKYNNEIIQSSPQSVDLVPPEVQTEPVDDFTHVSATLNLDVDRKGYHERQCIHPFFQYREQGESDWNNLYHEEYDGSDPPISRSAHADIINNGISLENLDPDTEYEYRAHITYLPYAEGDYPEDYTNTSSDIQSFTTAKATSVETLEPEPEDIGSHDVVLSANATIGALENGVIEYRIREEGEEEWIIKDEIDDLDEDGIYEGYADLLGHNITYEYKAIISGEIDRQSFEYEGNIVNFTTDEEQYPEVETGEYSIVSPEMYIVMRSDFELNDFDYGKLSFDVWELDSNEGWIFVDNMGEETYFESGNHSYIWEDVDTDTYYQYRPKLKFSEDIVYGENDTFRIADEEPYVEALEPVEVTHESFKMRLRAQLGQRSSLTVEFRWREIHWNWWHSSGRHTFYSDPDKVWHYYETRHWRRIEPETDYQYRGYGEYGVPSGPSVYVTTEPLTEPDMWDLESENITQTTTNLNSTVNTGTWISRFAYEYRPVTKERLHFDENMHGIQDDLCMGNITPHTDEAYIKTRIKPDNFSETQTILSQGNDSENDWYLMLDDHEIQFWYEGEKISYVEMDELPYPPFIPTHYEVGIELNFIGDYNQELIISFYHNGERQYTSADCLSIPTDYINLTSQNSFTVGAKSEGSDSHFKGSIYYLDVNKNGTIFNSQFGEDNITDEIIIDESYYINHIDLYDFTNNYSCINTWKQTEFIEYSMSIYEDHYFNKKLSNLIIGTDYQFRGVIYPRYYHYDPPSISRTEIHNFTTEELEKPPELDYANEIRHQRRYSSFTVESEWNLNDFDDYMYYDDLYTRYHYMRTNQYHEEDIDRETFYPYFDGNSYLQSEDDIDIIYNNETKRTTISLNIIPEDLQSNKSNHNTIVSQDGENSWYIEFYKGHIRMIMNDEVILSSYIQDSYEDYPEEEFEVYIRNIFVNSTNTRVIALGTDFSYDYIEYDVDETNDWLNLSGKLTFGSRYGNSDFYNGYILDAEIVCTADNNTYDWKIQRQDHINKLEFDGENDYIEIDGDPFNSTTDFTLSAYIRPDIAQEDGMIFTLYNESASHSNYPLMIYLEDGDIKARINLDGEQVLLSYNLPYEFYGDISLSVKNKQWNGHNYTTISLYLDDNLVVDEDIYSNHLPILEGDSIKIGHYDNYGYYKGMIDDIRIIDKSLDEYQIDEITRYEQQYDKLAHWMLNEGSGNTIYDNISSFDGTITGANWVYTEVEETIHNNNLLIENVAWKSYYTEINPEEWSFRTSSIDEDGYSNRRIRGLPSGTSYRVVPILVYMRNGETIASFEGDMFTARTKAVRPRIEEMNVTDITPDDATLSAEFYSGDFHQRGYTIKLQIRNTNETSWTTVYEDYDDDISRKEYWTVSKEIEDMLYSESTYEYRAILDYDTLFPKEKTITFESERIVPQINITSPLHNETFTSGRDFKVEWEILDERAEFNRFEIRINNSPWIDVGKDYNYTFDLDEEIYRVEVRCYDDRDRIESEDSVEFEIDETMWYAKLPVWPGLFALMIISITVALVKHVKDYRKRKRGRIL